MRESCLVAEAKAACTRWHIVQDFPISVGGVGEVENLRRHLGLSGDLSMGDVLVWPTTRGEKSRTNYVLMTTRGENDSEN